VSERQLWRQEPIVTTSSRSSDEGYRIEGEAERLHRKCKPALASIKYNRSRIPQSDPSGKQFSLGAPLSGRSCRTKGRGWYRQRRGASWKEVRQQDGIATVAEDTRRRDAAWPAGPHPLGNGRSKYTGAKRQRTSHRERERERERARAVPSRMERSGRQDLRRRAVEGSAPMDRCADRCAKTRRAKRTGAGSLFDRTKSSEDGSWSPEQQASTRLPEQPERSSEADQASEKSTNCKPPLTFCIIVPS